MAGTPNTLGWAGAGAGAALGGEAADGAKGWLSWPWTKTKAAFPGGPSPWLVAGWPSTEVLEAADGAGAWLEEVLLPHRLAVVTEEGTPLCSRVKAGFGGSVVEASLVSDWCWRDINLFVSATRSKALWSWAEDDLFVFLAIPKGEWMSSQLKTKNPAWSAGAAELGSPNLVGVVAAATSAGSAFDATPDKAALSWEAVFDEAFLNGDLNWNPVHAVEEFPKPLNFKPSDTELKVLPVVERDDPKVEEEEEAPPSE